MVSTAREQGRRRKKITAVATHGGFALCNIAAGCRGNEAEAFPVLTINRTRLDAGGYFPNNGVSVAFAARRINLYV